VCGIRTFSEDAAFSVKKKIFNVQRSFSENKEIYEPVNQYGVRQVKIMKTAGMGISVILR